MKMNNNIEIAGLSDVGLVRTHNEDKIGWEIGYGVVILADGMGGHNAGEVASDMAIRYIIEGIKKEFEEVFNENGDALNEHVPVYISLNVINEANRLIHEAAKSESTFAGMGTTLVMAMFDQKNITISNIGDSRLYRLRDDKLEQLTTDHSLLQEMIQSGFLTKEEAHRTVNKNMITRALGIGDDVEIDVHQHETQHGDLYLLCSDGLTDLVENEQLYTILHDGFDKTLGNTAHQLVLAANNMGGMDNISVILAKIP